MAGVKGRSGRKPESRVRKLNEIIERIWTEEKRETCLTILMNDCESSDFQVRNESRKLLFAYAFGKPTEKHEVGGSENEPIIVKVVYAK